MKPKTIEVIMQEVAKENGKTLVTGHLSKYWIEVCKRREIEVAKASLEKASENIQYEDNGGFDADGNWCYEICVIKSSIADEQNIVL